jgi:hypothetical protein
LAPNESALHPESLANGRLPPGLTLAAHRRAPLRPPRGHPADYLRQLSCCSGGLLGLRHHAFNGHNLGDGASLDFGSCQQKTHGISFPGAMTTSRGRLRLCSILTFYYAGLRQCSLYGRRHGLSSGEGSGLLGSRRGIFFSHCCAGFISLPGQVC